MSSVRNNVWLRVETVSNSRYFTCGTLDRSLKFAKSRFTHKIIIIILNRFFRGKRRANTKTRVLVSGTNLVCGSNCHLDISGTNVPRGTVHSGWPAVQMCQKSQITWFDVRKRLQTLKNDEKCWKQSLEVGQNTLKGLRYTAVHLYRYLRYICTANRNLVWMGLYHF